MINNNIDTLEDPKKFNFIWKILNFREKYQEVVNNVNLLQSSLKMTKESYVMLFKEQIGKLINIKNLCSKEIIGEIVMEEKKKVGVMFLTINQTTTAEDAKRSCSELECHVIKVTAIEKTDNCPLSEKIKMLCSLIDKNLWKDNYEIIEACICHWSELRKKWYKSVVMYEKDILRINEDGRNFLVNYYREYFQRQRLKYAQKIQDRFGLFGMNYEENMNKMMIKWKDEKKIWEKKIEKLVNQRVELSIYLSELPYNSSVELFDIEKEIIELKKKISLLKIKNLHQYHKKNC
uniref:Uncharacterized protein n=1 Tax=Strongyloides venezuelensis TaxID=75913 RepID=A0A0K0FPZ9_STRVS